MAWALGEAVYRQCCQTVECNQAKAGKARLPLQQYRGVKILLQPHLMSTVIYATPAQGWASLSKWCPESCLPWSMPLNPVTVIAETHARHGTMTSHKATCNTVQIESWQCNPNWNFAQCTNSVWSDNLWRFIVLETTSSQALQAHHRSYIKVCLAMDDFLSAHPRLYIQCKVWGWPLTCNTGILEPTTGIVQYQKFEEVKSCE